MLTTITLYYTVPPQQRGTVWW